MHDQHQGAVGVFCDLLAGVPLFFPDPAGLGWTEVNFDPVNGDPFEHLEGILKIVAGVKAFGQGVC